MAVEGFCNMCTHMGLYMVNRGKNRLHMAFRAEMHESSVLRQLRNWARWAGCYAVRTLQPGAPAARWAHASGPARRRHPRRRCRCRPPPRCPPAPRPPPSAACETGSCVQRHTHKRTQTQVRFRFQFQFRFRFRVPVPVSVHRYHLSTKRVVPNGNPGIDPFDRVSTHLLAGSTKGAASVLPVVDRSTASIHLSMDAAAPQTMPSANLAPEACRLPMATNPRPSTDQKSTCDRTSLGCGRDSEQTVPVGLMGRTRTRAAH